LKFYSFFGFYGPAQDLHQQFDVVLQTESSSKCDFQDLTMLGLYGLYSLDSVYVSSPSLGQVASSVEMELRAAPPPPLGYLTSILTSILRILLNMSFFSGDNKDTFIAISKNDCVEESILFFGMLGC
jgi:hypothetical protein